MTEPGNARETWITGIGIVSCLGEGLDAHWQGLDAPPPTGDTTSFAPYVVHRIVPLEMDKQIPKKGDQRQMEPWQRIGTYAAGLALEGAGVKGKPEFLSRMDMIVAAGGGERDAQVDLNVAANVDKAAKAEAFVNERLMNDLRPTLFLAQLSNLLAGNISIVHGVTGSSRTFMGEESAGVEAVRVAHARIQANQSDLALVGGAYNAERWEVMLHFALGRRLARGAVKPVWERGGMQLGTIGAFLVLEEKRARAGAWRNALRAHRGGRVGSRAAHAGRGYGGAVANVGHDRTAARCHAGGGDLRRLGRRTGDRRGTRVSRAPEPCRPRHRDPSRSRARAAVSG